MVESPSKNQIRRAWLFGKDKIPVEKLPRLAKLKDTFSLPNSNLLSGKNRIGVPYLRIVKKIKYDDHNVVKSIEKNLSQLSKDKDTFQFIKIPDFSYEIENDIVTVEHEFIRGVTIGTLIKIGHREEIHNYGKQIYKDLVLRENKWTFLDYTFDNFIVCDLTKELYIIDLEFYKAYDLNSRKQMFFNIYGSFDPNYDWVGYK